MSKIGKKPITLTSAKVQVQGNLLTISGPKGSFKHELPQGLSALLEGKSLSVKSEKKERKDRVVW